MAVVGELLVLIGGNGGPLTASLAKAEAELKGFSAGSKTHGGAIATAFAGIRTAAIGVGVASAAGLLLGAKAAADFQEQMAIINTIAHQTPEELDKTGQSIRKMSVESGTALPDLTSAFYDLLSAGVQTKDAINVLGLANTLAIGGLATTKQTVDLLTTAINAYGLDAKGAAVATDQFALAVQDGKVTADQIAVTFADVADIAKTAGIGIDEIAASYAFLTAAGKAPADVTTQMNRAIVELLKPNAALLDLQKKTGTSFADVASQKGLVVALQEMRVAADAAGIPFQDLFGRLEGYKFALATTGPAFAAYSAELVKMHSANGTAAAQAEERMGTFNRQVAILGTSLTDLGISIGTAILPGLTSFVQSVSGVVQAIGAWSTANPGLASNLLLIGTAIGAVAVATLLLGPLFGALASVFGVIAGVALALATPFGLIAGLVVLVVAGLLDLLAVFGLLGPQAQGMATSVNTFVGDMVGKVIAWFQSIIPGVVTALSELPGRVLATINAIVPPALAALGNFASQVVAWISAQLPIWTAQISQWAAAFWGWITPMIPPALAALGQFTGQVVAWISAQLPIWMAQISQWASAFWSWISPMIPVALAALGQFAGSVATWIVAQIPGWTAQVGQWASAFVGWVGVVAPQVLAALGGLASQLLGWIGSQLPAWTAQIGQWVSAFVDWVAPMIPVVLGALGQWSASVLNWVLSQIPEWAAQLMKLADAFVGWIIPLIPQILAGLGLVTLSILNWAVGMIPHVVGALVQLGLAIISWVIGEIPHLVVALARLGAALIAWIAPKIPGLLLELAKFGASIPAWVIGTAVPLVLVELAKLGLAFIGWVAKSVPGLLVELGKFGAAIVAFLVGLPAALLAAAIAVGASIISGIIKGIGEVAGAVGAWLFGKPIPAFPTPGGGGAPHTPNAVEAPAYHGLTSAGYTPTPTTVGGVPIAGMFQHGGIVPGTGAQLIVAHGGETVIPPGGGGGTTIVNHIHVSLDGSEIAEFIEQRLFRNASGFSSGFTSPNPVTGA